MRIQENQPGFSAVHTVYVTGEGERIALDWRLSTGQVIIEMNPGEGVDAVHVDGRTKYLVVPDFFGDDLVYCAASCPEGKIGLPAENFYLHLLEGGGGLIACVWESHGRRVRARGGATSVALTIFVVTLFRRNRKNCTRLHRTSRATILRMIRKTAPEGKRAPFRSSM